MSGLHAAPPMTRSPNGCSAKPIRLSLTPEERTEIERLAERECRSMAAMARLLVLKGLEDIREAGE